MDIILQKIQVWLAFLVFYSFGAVIPPPWANPQLNPCASQPRGWQLLFWPPDGKCYKIFQIGYPCPEGMELTPAVMTNKNQELLAECRCPPKTALSRRDGKCYELFTLGPCEKGWYFSPDLEEATNNISKQRIGVCKQIKKCHNKNEVFWPFNEQCYERFTKGPCAKGQLITLSADWLGVCKCNNRNEMKEFYYGSGCYQHFTKGPCKEKGHLFLPDKNCGCHSFLPHFHEETGQCFEIGSIGPCNEGELYQMDYETRIGKCKCKHDYIRYENSLACYRPYTQGPCSTGYILLKNSTCTKLTCKRNQLYFPQKDRCYRIGSRGPCPKGKVVTFDFNTRPSVDGISYNGVCKCGSNGNCEEDAIECEENNNMVLYENKCYKLYTQGPCAKGAWMTLQRHKKELWSEVKNYNKGICECMPGYTKTIHAVDDKNITECIPPTVILANYLNKNYYADKIN